MRHTLRVLLLPFLLLAAAGAPQARSGPRAPLVLEQFGITWTFDADYPSGRFANGDWWVVGPVRIVRIDPVTETGRNRVSNGSMVNPSPSLGTRQGYDSHMYAQYRQAGDYDPTLNVAAGISPERPLVLPPHSSLVSTVSRLEPEERPQILSAAILTVLPQAPPTGSFRPPYCGSDKTVLFNASQVDPTMLRRLPIPTSVRDRLPSLADVERLFERPWLDHVPLWMGRYIHPSRNMPDYGREIVDDVGVGAIYMHLDLVPEMSKVDLFKLKRTLVVRYIQLGIDLFGVAVDGGFTAWRSAGGHMSGRKWPILFAGLMLDYAPMARIGFTNRISFGEDDQTFYVEETSPGVYNNGYGGYTQEMVGLPEWGQNHPNQPWLDDAEWTGDPYRHCCTANAWWGQLLAAYVMGARDDWNHEALFDYQDRYLRENLKRGIKDWRLAWRDWPLRLWIRYRTSFGPLWKP